MDKSSEYKVSFKNSKIIDGKTDSFIELPKAIETIDIVNFEYEKANSVNVEWSFLVYKNILSDRRKSLKFENICKILLYRLILIIKAFNQRNI